MGSHDVGGYKILSGYCSSALYLSRMVYSTFRPMYESKDTGRAHSRILQVTHLTESHSTWQTSTNTFNRAFADTGSKTFGGRDEVRLALPHAEGVADTISSASKFIVAHNHFVVLPSVLLAKYAQHYMFAINTLVLVLRAMQLDIDRDVLESRVNAINLMLLSLLMDMDEAARRLRMYNSNDFGLAENSGSFNRLIFDFKEFFALWGGV